MKLMLDCGRSDQVASSDLEMSFTESVKEHKTLLLIGRFGEVNCYITVTTTLAATEIFYEQ